MIYSFKFNISFYKVREKMKLDYVLEKKSKNKNIKAKNYKI